jgi:hypothetical protein
VVVAAMGVIPCLKKGLQGASQGLCVSPSARWPQLAICSESQASSTALHKPMRQHSSWTTQGTTGITLVQ